MVSVIRLQGLLTDNYELILKVLLKLGFDEDKIKYDKHKGLITAPRPEEGADNPHGCLIYTSNLYVMMTTRVFSGNIFTLTSYIKKCNFAESLKKIASWLNIEDVNRKLTLPFNGFYRPISKYFVEPELAQREYDWDNDLPSPLSLSQSFFQDGIAYDIQEKWGVRYDHESDHVLIPIQDCFGRLIGCKARNNDPNCSTDKRWYAYLGYGKTASLYGYYQNYQHIVARQTVVIFEAEKSVLQAASFGFNLGLAVAGHNISPTQAKYIKSLMVKRVVLAFDADVSEEELQYEARKLQVDVCGYKNEVSYIYDKTHTILGGKDSPTDHGREHFQVLLKKYLTNL